MKELMTEQHIDTQPIMQMVNDLMSIKPRELEELFAHLDDALTFKGSYWRHSSRSNYTSISFRFDKYIHEEVLKAIKKLHPSTSIVSGKSLGSIVSEHIKSKYVLKLDLKGYYESLHFSSIERSLVTGGFSDELRNYIASFYFTDKKSLRRGLRASPVLSEFVGLRIDNLVKRTLFATRNEELCYSRYYDDLIISGDDRSALRLVEQALINSLGEIGLKVNARKTKIQHTHTARILGLRIHCNRLGVPKEFKKILRARVHRLNQYLSQVECGDGWGDSEKIHEAKVMIGRVIGSIWYIVNNSPADNEKYSLMLKQYYGILEVYSEQLNNLLGHVDILNIKY